MNKNIMEFVLRSFLVLSIVTSTGMAANAAPGSRSWDTGNDAPASNERPPAQQITPTQAPSVPPTNNTTNNFTTDPCPEPKKALGSTPDDLARIQEDITRFTLCVQRAQLLERLNELAKANIETIDSALNLVASPDNAPMAIPTQGQNDGGMMGNIPVPALPDSISQMLQDEESSEASSNTAEGRAPRERRRPLNSEWRIREIQGSGGSVYARLMDDRGTILRVSEGDELPDDGGRISSLTNSFVRITKDGESTNLRWVD